MTGELVSARGNRALTQTNLAIRIELLTDSSIALLTALDLRNTIAIRDKALYFKNELFGLFFRTRTTLEQYYDGKPKNKKVFTEVDSYIMQVMNHDKGVDALELIKIWGKYCHMLNESGITDITFEEFDPLKAFERA